MSFDKKRVVVGAATVAAGLLIALWASFVEFPGGPSKGGPAPSAPKAADANRSPYGTPQRPSTDPLAAQSVELSASEFEQFKVEPAGERDFTIQREAVGNIAFNDEMSVQVFPPVPGKIITLFARAGDDVQKGTPLYTIDSPDLVQAGSSLIAAAGVLDLTTRTLKRAKQLYEIQGIAEKDLNQAVSDQQAAEGAFKAARDAVRIFGKTDADMNRIIAERKIDPVLVVRSPITGRVTARNAAPGLLVQPGNPPAPYTLADISTMWMLANVAETDFPFLRLGEEVDVSVKAYPGRAFRGKIVNIGASVDPSTHRVLVRSEVRDPTHELRPGMFATFVIRTGTDVRSPAVPLNGVVREGDGSMTVWVTTDRKRLVKRTVKVGLQQNGFDQILEGLKPGELVATEGALFLSNALTEASR
ncbi:MAG TPA: efflux RND transporter periplasmic adaptor subunit [Nitrospirales bacterium]|nr:efflux RND transporter periplasmic adaptor subunit [Nitrospirales bacterium]